MKKFVSHPSESSKQLAVFATFYIASIVFLLHLFPSLSRLNDGDCDPWYYFGSMLTTQIFPSYGRLAIILPTYIFGRLFGIGYLETFFFVSTLSIIAVTIFAALRMLFDPLSAAFAAVITSLSGYLLSVSSTTYTSPALAYGCISFWLLCRSLYSRHTSGKYLLLFFSGFALAWTFNAHPIAFVVVVPLFLIGLAGRTDSTTVAWRLEVAIFIAILGFGVGTAVIGLLGHILYGDFFDVAIFQAASIYQGVTNPNTNYQISRWLKPDWWRMNSISPILLLSVGSSLFFALQSKRKIYDLKILCAISAALPVVAFFVLNLLGKTVILNYAYYIIFFFLPLAICLCLIFHLLTTKWWPDGPSIWSFASATAAMNGSMIFILWLTWHFWLTWYFSRNVSWYFQTILIAVVLMLSILAMVWAGRSRGRAKLLILGLCFLLFPAAYQSFRYTEYGSTLWDARLRGYPARYMIIKRAVSFVSRETHGAFPNFWISASANKQVRQGLFRSFSRCTYETNFPAKLPSAEVNWQNKLAPGEFLVIVTSPGQPIDLGRNLLRQHGMNFELVGSKEFVQGRFNIAVHVVKLIHAI